MVLCDIKMPKLDGIEFLQKAGEINNDVPVIMISGHGNIETAVEAVKTVSDLYLPVSGTIEELNEDLASAPEAINQDPYGEGWIIKMTLSAPEELNDLLDAKAYDELTA